MTGNSVLAKYNRKEAAADAVDLDSGDALDDLGAFGWLRGVRDRALMLELRHKDGRVSAFGYAWLDHAEFDPSEGITLHFMGREVRIIGRNLNGEAQPNVRLFSGIVRHRVPWVQEAGGPDAMQAGSTVTVIDKLVT